MEQSQQIQANVCGVLRETPETASRALQAVLNMLNMKFMTVKSEKDWTSMAVLEGFPWRNLSSLKMRQQHKKRQELWDNVLLDRPDQSGDVWSELRVPHL